MCPRCCAKSSTETVNVSIICSSINESHFKLLLSLSGYCIFDTFWGVYPSISPHTSLFFCEAPSLADKRSDPNLTTVPTHTRIKHVARSPCCEPCCLRVLLIASRFHREPCVSRIHAECILLAGPVQLICMP